MGMARTASQRRPTRAAGGTAPRGRVLAAAALALLAHTDRAAAQRCALGLTRCAGECVDTDGDSANCGACAVGCLLAQRCSRGRCVAKPASLLTTETPAISGEAPAATGSSSDTGTAHTDSPTTTRTRSRRTSRPTPTAAEASSTTVEATLPTTEASTATDYSDTTTSTSSGSLLPGPTGTPIVLFAGNGNFLNVFTDSESPLAPCRSTCGVQCNADSGLCFLEPDTRGSDWIVDCHGAPNCSEYKLVLPGNSSACLANLGTLLLADCQTGDFLVPQRRRSLLARLAARFSMSFVRPAEKAAAPVSLIRRQGILPAFWSLRSIPGSGGLSHLQSAVSSPDGGNCLRHDLYVGQCEADGATSWSAGGSATAPPAAPAAAPPNLGLIIGCVVGGLLAAIALVGIAICARRRSKANRVRAARVSTAGVPVAAPANVAAPLYTKPVELAPLEGSNAPPPILELPAEGTVPPPSAATAFPAHGTQPRPFSPSYTEPVPGIPTAPLGVAPLNAARGSLPPLVIPTAAQVDLAGLGGRALRVIQPYAPRMQDEMPIRVGDVLRVEQAFDDAWGFATNVKTGRRGYVPLTNLAAP